jgi:hypothetical protein
MSAAELRQAAETLRGRAKAATPGTWGVGNRTNIATEVEQHVPGSYSYKHAIASLDETDYSDEYVDPRENWAGEEEDAAYIVTMQPGVGLALADWLDWTFDQGHDGDMDDNGCSECAPALAVARLINGGAS